jgi:hypothetical protein
MTIPQNNAQGHFQKGPWKTFILILYQYEYGYKNNRTL